MAGSSKHVRLGVVGVGGMGGHHIRLLLDGKVRRCRLTALCDVNPEFLGRYNDDVEKFTSFRKMCRSGIIDAVLIATPHYAHTPLAIEAFRAGLHVLCEKPLAVHKADAEKMIKACPRNRKFAVMFQMRVSPLFKKVKQMIDDDKLGRVTRINMIATHWFRSNAYYAGGGWRATWKGEGGGVLINQCPHDLDAWQWICGMPTRIHSVCGFGKWHNIEVEDDVTAIMEYPGGATGVFVASTGEAPGVGRFEICGELGRILIEDDELRFTRNASSALTFIKKTKNPFARPASRDIAVRVGTRNPGHRGIIQNFTDAILDNKPLISPGRDAINQVELTNAMIYSGATGQPVDLPLNGRAYKRFLGELVSGKRNAG